MNILNFSITEWISIFMAAIATASAIITHAVYRSSTDPEIIVYADTDKKRPSIINLIIKNIGKGPAKDITFKTSKKLPKRAYGIEEPNDMAEVMDSGPIISGIPYMAPNQEIIITWGQYGGLKKYIGKGNIVVTAQYKRTTTINIWKKSSSSKLFIEAFYGSDMSDSNWDKKLVDELKITNNILKKWGGL